MSGVQAGQCPAADAPAAKPVVIQVWITSRLGVLSKRPASADGRLSFIGGNIRCGPAAVKPAVNRFSSLRTGRRSPDGGSPPPWGGRREPFIIPCRRLPAKPGQPLSGGGSGRERQQPSAQTPINGPASISKNLSPLICRNSGADNKSPCPRKLELATAAESFNLLKSRRSGRGLMMKTAFALAFVLLAWPAAAAEARQESRRAY